MGPFRIREIAGKSWVLSPFCMWSGWCTQYVDNEGRTFINLDHWNKFLITSARTNSLVPYKPDTQQYSSRLPHSNEESSTQWSPSLFSKHAAKPTEAHGVSLRLARSLHEVWGCERTYTKRGQPYHLLSRPWWTRLPRWCQWGPRLECATVVLLAPCSWTRRPRWLQSSATQTFVCQQDCTLSWHSSIDWWPSRWLPPLPAAGLWLSGRTGLQTWLEAAIHITQQTRCDIKQF